MPFVDMGKTKDVNDPDWIGFSDFWDLLLLKTFNVGVLHAEVKML